jgi:hypothetical protein
MECKFILYFDINMKENKSSKIKRKLQMLLIRIEKIWTVPGLEDILQAANRWAFCTEHARKNQYGDIY